MISYSKLILLDKGILLYCHHIPYYELYLCIWMKEQTVVRQLLSIQPNFGANGLAVLRPPLSPNHKEEEELECCIVYS
jgi:hypothetical protein